MIGIDNSYKRPGRKRPIPLFRTIPKQQRKERSDKRKSADILQISGATVGPQDSEVTDQSLEYVGYSPKGKKNYCYNTKHVIY